MGNGRFVCRREDACFLEASKDITCFEALNEGLLEALDKVKPCKVKLA